MQSDKIETEKCLISSILLDENSLDKLGELLPSDFADDTCREIYKTCVEMRAKNLSVNERTIAGEIAGKVSTYDLTGIIEKLPSAGAAKTLAGQVLENSRKRSLGELGGKIQDAAMNGESSSKILENIEDIILHLRTKSQQSGSSLKDIAFQTLKQIDEGTTATPTGFKGLDFFITGLVPGNFVVIAARPAIGKSALAKDIFCNLALRQKIAADFYTLEMSSVETFQRIISSECKIEMSRVKNKGVSNIEQPKINNFSAAFSNLPVNIFEGNCTVSGIQAEVRKGKKERDLKVVFIDYLQLLTPSSADQNRNNEVSKMTRELKLMALDYGITIVALSQLSRSSEMNGQREPELHDLRDSGSIEQDADIVIFLHQAKDCVNALIKKNRNGSVGRTSLLWNGPFVTFTTMERSGIEKKLEAAF